MNERRALGRTVILGEPNLFVFPWTDLYEEYKFPNETLEQFKQRVLDFSKNFQPYQFYLAQTSLKDIQQLLNWQYTLYDLYINTLHPPMQYRTFEQFVMLHAPTQKPAFDDWLARYHQAHLN